MGKINKGILDGFSGTVGNVVGANWKSINYIRTKPNQVKNPRTPKQMAQRRKFIACSIFVRGIMSEIVRPIWDQSATNMSGYNYMMQKNISAFNEKGEISQFSKLIIATGPLVRPDIRIDIDKGNSKIFNLSWKYNSNIINYSGEDILHIIKLITDNLDNELLKIDANAKRKDGHLSLDLSNDMEIQEGCSQHFYFYFSDAENSIFSDSQYVGIAVV